VPDTREIAVADGAVPNQYQLGHGEAIRLQTVEATFDGAGAAGDFLPCVAIYSQSGRLLSRTFPASSMAVGDQAAVTFAPF
jgi:hypothetical protein